MPGNDLTDVEEKNMENAERSTPRLSFAGGKGAVYAILRDMRDEDGYQLLRHFGETWVRHVAANKPSTPQAERHLSLVK
jgi:hypothetical protein